MKISIGWLLLGLSAVLVFMYRDRLFALAGSTPQVLNGGATPNNNPNSVTGGQIARDVSSAAASIADSIASIFSKQKSSAQTAPATT